MNLQGRDDADGAFGTAAEDPRFMFLLIVGVQVWWDWRFVRFSSERIARKFLYKFFVR